jgi:hypothetical protein
MGTAVSLLMIAAGAIMAWAVTTTSSSFNVHTVGIILIVVERGGHMSIWPLILIMLVVLALGGFGYSRR